MVCTKPITFLPPTVYNSLCKDLLNGSESSINPFLGIFLDRNPLVMFSETQVHMQCIQLDFVTKDWIGCKVDSRSTMVYVYTYAEEAGFWRSKKESVFTSCTEDVKYLPFRYRPKRASGSVNCFLLSGDVWIHPLYILKLTIKDPSK